MCVCVCVSHLAHRGDARWGSPHACVCVYVYVYVYAYAYERMCATQVLMYSCVCEGVCVCVSHLAHRGDARWGSPSARVPSNPRSNGRHLKGGEGGCVCMRE